MKIKSLYFLLSLLVAISMVLAACAPQAAATTEAPVAQTEAPADSCRFHPRCPHFMAALCVVKFPRTSSPSPGISLPVGYISK